MATPYIALEITSSISKTNSRGRPSNSHKHVLLEQYELNSGLISFYVSWQEYGERDITLYVIIILK